MMKLLAMSRSALCVLALAFCCLMTGGAAAVRLPTVVSRASVATVIPQEKVVDGTVEPQTENTGTTAQQSVRMGTLVDASVVKNSNGDATQPLVAEVGKQDSTVVPVAEAPATSVNTTLNSSSASGTKTNVPEEQNSSEVTGTSLESATPTAGSGAAKPSLSQEERREESSPVSAEPIVKTPGNGSKPDGAADDTTASQPHPVAGDGATGKHEKGGSGSEGRDGELHPSAVAPATTNTDAGDMSSSSSSTANLSTTTTTLAVSPAPSLPKNDSAPPRRADDSTRDGATWVRGPLLLLAAAAIACAVC